MKELQRLTIALVAMILGWAVAAQAQAVHGTGTTNTIPVWTSSSTIGNSLMTQSGGNVNVSANLTLTGSINNSLTLQGNLSDSNGDESANVIGGFGGNSTFLGNRVASGVVGATIAGGGGGLLSFAYPNVVSGTWGTVGGGANNQAGGGNSSTVAGGFQNLASGTAATVGGGNQNTASGLDATVGGGGINTASGDGATVGGGGNNTASGLSATVAGGAQNTASLEGATVCGGENNQATGKFATVAGGQSSFAKGQYSFAAGYIVTATSDGSFVWGDSTGVTFDTGPNQFVARASGGFTFYTAPGSGTQTGATLAMGSGSWSSLSDRDAKANISAVDSQGLLARLAALPIATWNYKAQPDSVRHVGPMAQDFHAAFGLGEDDKHISTVDAEGVALAAIQALYQTVTELKQDLGDKERQIAELRARLALLEQRQ